jgi:hypothetical protein
MAWRWDAEAVPEDVEQMETGTETPRIKIPPPDPKDYGTGWVSVEAGRDKPDKPGDPGWRWVIWHKTTPAQPGRGRCGLAGP